MVTILGGKTYFFLLIPNPLLDIFASPKSEFFYSDLKYGAAVFLSEAVDRAAIAPDFQPKRRE